MMGRQAPLALGSIRCSEMREKLVELSTSVKGRQLRELEVVQSSLGITRAIRANGELCPS